MTTSPKSPARYKVSIPLHAVKLEPHPGSSLRDPTGVLVEIPANPIIESEGPVAGSGLIKVLWKGDAFSVFYEDLREKAQILSAEAYNSALGIVNLNKEPAPGFDSTQMRPPYLSTIRWQIASPIPVPS